MDTTTHSSPHPHRQPRYETPQWFVARLASMTLTDLDRVSAAVEESVISFAGWLEWRKSVAATDRALRRAGRVKEAGVAAHAAAATVTAAFEHQVTLPDPRVTLIARAAREAAAALVIDDVEPRDVSRLLAPWLERMTDVATPRSLASADLQPAPA